MKAAEVVEKLRSRFPNEPEYIQAVSQVLATIEEEYNKHPEFEKSNLIERLCIPDRLIEFRVTWVDDKGNVQTNMGYRIQHNNAFPPVGESFYFEVPCLRTDLQELADNAPHGRRKGRFRLLTPWKKQRRSHAFLSGFYE